MSLKNQASDIRSVVIVANPDKDKARQETPRLRQWLKRKHIATLPASSISRADGIITLGGDGTILSIAPQAAAAGVPVLGINVGRVGFLTSVEQKRMYPFLEAWLKGRLVIDERMMLEVVAPRIKAPQLALNDAVIRIGATSRVTTVFASIEKEDVGCFVGDGVIVATPTGSTAYSLSAQGPVLHPGVEALMLTPICAHSFTQRPVVFPAHQTLDLQLRDIRERTEVQLCLDGQRVFSLKSGDCVSVRRANATLQLISDPSVSYFEVLREKLSWGGR